MTLDGDDVDDHLLEVLVRGGTFRETQELVLSQASLSDFHLLLELPKLRVLELNELTPEKLDLARTMTWTKPALSVLVNGTSVH